MDLLQHWKEVTRDQDKITKLSKSLENYYNLLNDSEVSEDDNVIQEVIAYSLETIDPHFDIKEGGKVTLRAIKEGLIVAAKATRDIIRYIWEMLTSFYVKFTGSIKRVRGKQENINKRLGKLGSKTTYTKMNISGLQRLSIDGNFIGMNMESLLDIKDTTNYILNKYPKSVIRIARDCSRHFLNIVENNKEADREELAGLIISKFSDILQSSFVAPPGATQISERESGSVSKDTYRSVVLAGNNAFLFTPPSIIKRSLKSKNIVEDVVKKSFVMQFSELQLNVADNSEREIEVPDVRTLSEIVGVISSILSLAEKAEAGRRDFETVKTVVDDAIRQISENSDDVNRSSNVVLHIIGEISAKLAEPMGFYTHWLAVTLNVWLTFIDHCIQHYETDGV